MKQIVKERPVKLGIETYSVCNSKCVFCARRHIPTDKKLMSIELFGRVIEDYDSLGGGYLGFSLLLSDPLLDPLLLDRL